MAGDLEAAVTLMDVHVVPFPLPLDRPDVDTEHILRALKGLSDTSPIPVRVLVVLARDRQTTIRKLVPAGSLVVLTSRKRWWRTAEEALARTLKRDGHRVVLIKAGPSVCRNGGLRALPSVALHGPRKGEADRA